MSTNYLLVCDKHMERTDAVMQCGIAPGWFGGDAEETLMPFIVWHSGCSVRIIPEWHRDAESESYKQWTKENVEEMRERENLMCKEKQLPGEK